MARWLVVAEGADETGREHEQDGLLRRLVTQLVADGPEAAGALGRGEWAPGPMPEIHFQRAAHLALAYPQLPPPAPSGMARVSRRAELAAQAGRYDGVIVLVDNDNDKRRDRRRDVDEGFQNGKPPHAVGVAVQTLEAWLLADQEMALRAGAEPPKRPEALWGKRTNPHSNHPKCVWQRVLAAVPAGITRDDLLDAWSVARAASRSPSLREFCSRVVELIGELEPAGP